MEQHECIMKDELTLAIESIKTQNRWFMGIFGGAILLLLVGYGSLGTGYTTNKANITKINNDYAPLVVIQDISHDNRNLINILQLLPETTKDDLRYINAIKESQEFQAEALRRAAGSKRGGSSSSGNGSTQ